MKAILESFETKASSSAIWNLVWTAVVAAVLAFLVWDNGNMTPGLGIFIFIVWMLIAMSIVYFRLRSIAADYIAIAYKEADKEARADEAGKAAYKKAYEDAKKK